MSNLIKAVRDFAREIHEQAGVEMIGLPSDIYYQFGRLLETDEAFRARVGVGKVGFVELKIDGIVLTRLP